MLLWLSIQSGQRYENEKENVWIVTRTIEEM